MAEVAQNFLSSIWGALLKLGMKRVIALGLVGITLIGAILFFSYYLTKPTYETLYVGLSRDDVNKIGLALGEAGVQFDVSSQGDSVLVPVGTSEHARMLLAQKGLPTSSNAGYELFDNMGSLGLTSFMQQVTRQRALEGEIARTIQAVKGVRAARVHIVLPDKGYFRREDQRPSASVIIRTDASFLDDSAHSIRYLVAAAVPSLEVGRVTVMDTSGKLLASGDDSLANGPMFVTSLQKQVVSEVEANIRRQLAPILGVGHFQASVNVALNTDRKQINETVYDPDSKVERSMHKIKDSSSDVNAKASSSVSVEQNIPQEEKSDASTSPEMTAKHDRSEQTSNYEINSKMIATVRNGYSIDKLDVAVVLDKNIIIKNLPKGTKKADIEKAVSSRVAEIKSMVLTAAGIDSKRGDLLNVAAVDFIDSDDGSMAPVHRPFLEILAQYSSSILSAIALIVSVAMILFFGLRPLMNQFRQEQAVEEAEEVKDKVAVEGEEGILSSVDASQTLQAIHAANLARSDYEKLEEISRKMRTPPEKRLEKLVLLDEERFAHILRDWARKNAQMQPRT